MTAALRPGVFVQVGTGRILATLDTDRTLGRLPFMPEMIEHCGRAFRVSRRVVTTCCTRSGPRAFRDDDVFLLDGLRCSGAAHDGCQKACMMFWRAAWLRRVEGSQAAVVPDPGSAERLRAQLKTSQGSPGDFVEIKPLNDVIKTLDGGSNNRGLRLSPDMRLACGRRRHVTGRIDRIIVDGTGVMRKLHDTVRLEDSVCGCAHLTFGGCSRGEIMYWREMWLKRAESSPETRSETGA